MSNLNVFVVGLRPPDDHWKRMKAAWDACKMAGVEVPLDVQQFFGGTTPDDDGITVDLEKTDCLSDWRDGLRTGVEVDLSKLPADVSKIRFYTAW